MRVSPVAALALCALVTGVASAELPRSERKAAKAYLDGTLFTRIDLPCATGRHPYGVYISPLVEASPAAVNTDAADGFSAGAFHAESTYWGVGPNESMQVEEIDFDDEGIEIELEGVGPSEGNDTAVKLVDVNSLDDFKAAADRVFARSPLQDEHPDWPNEIRAAIAEKRLIAGMSKRQAFCVTGAPETTQVSEQDGKKVEIWTLRRSKGMKMGFWAVKMDNPMMTAPGVLRFVDGALVDAPTSTSGGLNLDD